MAESSETTAVPHDGIDYESTPLDRGAYLTAVIHLYRGEIARANTWRQRLDQTTNWAIFATASILGFAFSNEDPRQHYTLQFANLVLVLFVFLEARRFRFFDVWRARIRMIETNFFAPILRRRLTSEAHEWGSVLAGNLHEPRFHLTMMEAVRLRLLKNYLPIFGIVLIAWLHKLLFQGGLPEDMGALIARFELGPLPAWLAALPIGVLYASLLLVVVACRVDSSHRDDWDIGERVSAIDR